jgi:hypothetical protein
MIAAKLMGQRAAPRWFSLGKDDQPSARAQRL